MENLEFDKATKKIRKTKEEIKKQFDESIISDENENTDIEETASKVKKSEEAAAVIQEMEKIIRSKKSNILWLTYQHDKIFEKSKANEKSVNMVNQVGVSKSTMVFKIGMVKFINNYPKMKKSSV